MKKKIVGILICMLIFTTFTGAISSSSNISKSINESVDDMAYSHTILGEYGTYTGCEPCKYAHRALKYVYAGEYHPFYYVTFVYDKNTHAYQRIKNELGLIASPTVYFDGGYNKKVGASDVEEDMARYNASIIECGNRNIADIDLSVDVTWLGAVNNDPPDEATDVSIDGILNWTNAAMDVEVTIDNNEASQYNGHLHVYVTEIESTMWNDKFGDPYTFEFKSYAFNEDIAVSGGSTWSGSTIWDGEHQTDGHGTNFTNALQSNIMVIASVFDDSEFTDETDGCVAGVGTEDPKTYDVYFGDSNPPPKVENNISRWTTDVGPLSFDTTYYWKVDVWDNQGNPTYGDIWCFTTRDIDPPNTPTFPRPPDGVTGVYINTNLFWNGGDPDGDDVLYDIYFGTASPPLPLPLFVSNWSDTEYDLPLLLFDTTYYWQIVAWDMFDYTASGSNWSFTTEPNIPPNNAINPHPEDGADNVPGSAILKWNGSDPNPGDILTYDVYFGRTNPPGKKSSNQTENFYDPYGEDDMELFEEYYWRIVSWDLQKLKSDGENWSFNTGIDYPPDAPDINGPATVIAEKKYYYNFSAVDPEGENVSFDIDWGDDTTSGWTEYVESGTEITLNHTWAKIEGEPTYTVVITAIAKDIFDQIGDPSGLEVTVPRNKAASSFNFNLLSRMFERFPQVFRYILGIEGIWGYIEKMSNQPTKASTNFPLNNYVNVYWKFDTGSGDTAYDSSGHGYDGIIYGASWTTDTPSGDDYALDFDGVNDYVDLNTHSEDVSFNKIDDLIFTFYFKTSSNDIGMIYSLSNSLGTNPAVHIFLDNGTIGFTADVVGCGFTMWSNGTYNDGNWHCIKIIYHGSTSKPTVELYVDDEFDNSITEWVCPFYDDEFTRIKIGRRSHNSTNHFDGLIDEPKIIKYSGGNQKPDRVDIDGPTFGLVNEKLTFTFVTNDAENDTLYYQIDWGDGEITPWIGPKEPGEEFNESHSWSEGTYEINARAKDFWHNGWWMEDPFRVSIGNHAPEKPEQPDGPTIGAIDVEYTYSTNTIDMDGDRVYYNWSWGDGIFSGWLGPYDSGVTCVASHAWSEPGIYKVEVKARDEIAESDWSEPLNVSIVTPPSIEIGEITGGWFRVEAVIKNTGEWDAENVTWNIDLAGGLILRGRNSLGEIPIIPAGEETTINSSLIFGFGKTVITVSAEIPESSDAEEQEAFVLLFFIKVNLN